MSIPEFVTFTGIDARTDLDRVRALSAQYPIEWGILFSPKKQGRDPRYPALDLIRIAVDQLADDSDVHLSAHLCGMHSAKIMTGIDPGIDLTGFGRAQINTVKPDAAKIADFGRRHGVSVITQHRTLRFPNEDTVAWLYDCSGGKGDLPDKGWPKHPEEGRMVGYAGGIRPGNVRQVNAAIDVPEGERYWLDMETGVRVDDWLDLDLCEHVCQEIF